MLAGLLRRGRVGSASPTGRAAPTVGVSVPRPVAHPSTYGGRPPRATTAVRPHSLRVACPRGTDEGRRGRSARRPARPTARPGRRPRLRPASAPRRLDGGYLDGRHAFLPHPQPLGGARAHVED